MKIGLFPPIFLPLNLRNQENKWKEFGDVKGTKFLKTALKQLAECGSGRGILLHKNIQVVDSEGRNVALITSNMTKPLNNKIFDVKDDVIYWNVNLKRRPKVIDRLKGPLDHTMLRTYHNYTPAKGGYRFAPHM